MDKLKEIGCKNSEVQKLKTSLKYKEQEISRRMEASTDKLRKEINASASNLSVKLAQKAIYKYISDADKHKLIDDAIEELDKFAS